MIHLLINLIIQAQSDEITAVYLGYSPEIGHTFYIKGDESFFMWTGKELDKAQKETGKTITRRLYSD